MSFSSVGSAVVTGASSGIGRAVARHLAERGMSVYAVSRQVVAPWSHQNVRWIPCDVASSTEPVAKYCPDSISALIHCAGTYGSPSRHPFSETTAAEWRDVFAVNVDAQFMLTRALLPRLLKPPRGLVVSITSVAASDAPFRVAYGSSKAASRCMFSSLAAEMNGSTVAVVQLLPVRQIATEGLRARRPAGFSFDGYDEPEVVVPALERALTSTPGEVNGLVLEVGQS
jgi:cyclitol oxidoreductase